MLFLLVQIYVSYRTFKISGTIFDRSTLLDFAEVGCYLEYDLFGIETSHYQLTESIDMPSDAQRIQTVKFLLDEGYLDQVVISHDIHTKHRLVSSALLNSLYIVGLFEKKKPSSE